MKNKIIHRRNFKKQSGCLFLCALLLLIHSCKKEEVQGTIPGLEQDDVTVATAWADMSLYTIRFSAFNSPTYASRSLGYLGLAMYESIVPGDSAHRSLAGQLIGLQLPHIDVAQKYYW